MPRPTINSPDGQTTLHIQAKIHHLIIVVIIIIIITINITTTNNNSINSSCNCHKIR